MARRLIRQLVVVAAAGWAAWGACSVYDESLLLPSVGSGGTGGSEEDVSTGGSTTGGTGGTGGGGECVSAQWPDKPPAADAPSDDIEFVVAMRTIDFGEQYIADGGQVPPRTIGYDLDKECTGPGLPGLGDGNSCTLESWATSDTTDLPGGRDNALGKLIGEVNDRVTNFGTVSYNAQIAQGKVSLLFRVRGYNGQPNDDKVELTMFTPAALGAFGGRSVPEWDGLDRWPIADVSLIDGEPDQPKYIDVNAYVANGTIVGGMPAADLRLKIGITTTIIVELILSFVQTFFTAEIKQETRSIDGGDKQLWTFQNGVIAGRWEVNELLNQIDQFPDPLDLVNLPPICRTSASYPTFRQLICSFADIRHDLAPPTASCSALSIGLGFTAEEALLSDVYGLQALEDRCPGEPKDSCFVPFSDAGVDTDSGTGGTGGAAGMSGAAGADASAN